MRWRICLSTRRREVRCMCSPCRKLKVPTRACGFEWARFAAAWRVAARLLIAVPLTAADARVLRVAADPNNLPFSNERGEGFENRIVSLVARELGATVEYTWRAQRRGFFRETMKDGDCDLVAGVPRGFDP